MEETLNELLEIEGLKNARYERSGQFQCHRISSYNLLIKNKIFQSEEFF